MLLQDVKEQVFKLPPSDRLALVSSIIESFVFPTRYPYGVHTSLRKVKNAVNPLLGGVPVGRGGLVSSATD
jgi:hypothetical protein